MSDEPRLTLAEYARAIVQARARITRYLDASLFGDPCFDMLLDLYAGTEEGRTMYVTSSAVASRVPLTSALRYIALMEEHGLIERVPDPADARRRLVRMNETTRESVSRYLTDIAGMLAGRATAIHEAGGSAEDTGVRRDIDPESLS